MIYRHAAQRLSRNLFESAFRKHSIYKNRTISNYLVEDYCEPFSWSKVWQDSTFLISVQARISNFESLRENWGSERDFI